MHEVCAEDTLNDVLIPAQEVSSLPDGPTGLSIHPGAASLAGKGIEGINAAELMKMNELLKLKAYSKSTIKTYLNELAVFLRTIGRMQMLIRRAKGKKDRYVNLSPVLLDILREYIRTYRPQPKEFSFESEQTFTTYPVRTVQQIFSNAKNRAGIRKEIGIHSLRHSFATHLLDKGTDIRYIKDILGHFNIKTTERYLHVSKAKLVNIASPFDDLWRSHGIDW